ncbi:hypothetical protein [Nostoc sp. FACHB-888]|uniref:hypothetical protein n=1 Tax=Nostoc sp. FACHB-888 TaxID=2692842 RepID=UPI0016880027|nr:hypothetical protein [Nostoc sp. FACHB-888]MBD2242276.1 hypothetical protein [Nostoc sp. FACHB-888]
MSEVQRLIIKEDDEEYEIYVESNTAPEVPEEEEPGYRDGLPTLNIQEFQGKIRNYAKLAVGAFKNLPDLVSSMLLNFRVPTYTTKLPNRGTAIPMPLDHCAP